MKTYFYENRLKDATKFQTVTVYENKNFSFRTHWHHEAELAYVKSGTAVIGINKEAQKLSAGDICLFQGGDIHYYESSPEGSDIVTILFRTDRAKDFYTWLEGHIGISTFLTEAEVKEYGLTGIYDLSNRMCQEKREELYLYEERNKAYATLLLTEIMRKWPCRTGEGRNPNYLAGQKLMQVILGYIEQNVEMPLTMVYLAKHFHVDRFYLSKLFNQVTGMHFKNYLNRLRVTMAEEKLTSGCQSVADIAYECGFGSVRNFNRVFKDIKGGTPGEIRAKSESR